MHANCDLTFFANTFDIVGSGGKTELSVCALEQVHAGVQAAEFFRLKAELKEGVDVTVDHLLGTAYWRGGRATRYVVWRRPRWSLSEGQGGQQEH